MTITTAILLSLFASASPILEPTSKPQSEKFIEYQQNPTGNYIPSPVDFNSYKSTRAQTRATLPAEYDSRDEGLVLTPRNQGIDGSCWAMAATNAVQTSYYTDGYEEGYVTPQILTNCRDGFVASKEAGGNFYMSSACFFRMSGTADQDSIAFDAFEDECPATSVDDFQAYTLGSRLLPENDLTAIKEAVMTYGSVAALIYFSDTYYSNADFVYNCTLASPSPNHAVSIIGWIDDFRDVGAVWIVKNSWGDDIMNDGYFYVSFDDPLITSACVAYTSRVETTEIDNVHYYATTGMNGAYQFNAVGDATTGTTAFEATEEEELVYVGTDISEPDTEVAFRVLDAEGAILYESESIIDCELPGFYTFPIPGNIKIEGYFYITMSYRLQTEGSPFPVETAIEGYNDIVIQPSGTNWVNGTPIGSDTEYKFNLCTRVYSRAVLPTNITPTPESLLLIQNNSIINSTWEKAEHIQVFNLAGQQLLQINKESEQQLNLPEGLYLFTIVYKDKRTETHKLMIE